MSIYVNKQENIVFTGDYDGSVKKWSLSDLKLIKTLRAHPEGCPVYSLTGDDTSKALFSSSCNGEIKEWSQDTGEFVQMTIVTVGKSKTINNKIGTY